MPERPEKNAYEILGVSRTASQDDIKKRYRELARQYHPDVNQANPTATKTFAQITAAYKSVSDPDSRAVYDADLTLKEKRAEAAARHATRHAAHAGTAHHARTPHAPSSATATGPTQAQRNQAEALRLLANAQAAFTRGRLVEARSLAEQSLRLNRKHDKPYELLGDIYRLQGKTEEAINMYSMALQLNPRNPQLMQRLERLTRMTGGTPSPSAQRVFFDNSSPRESVPPPYTPRAAPVSAPRPAAGPAYVPPPGGIHRQSLGLLTVGFVGYVGVLIMIVYTMFYPGATPQGAGLLPLISKWNGTIWSVLALSGLVLGATMTITGAIRRLEDELIITGIGPRTGFHLPMGLLVIVLSVINFYLAAVVYAITALLQESFTQSMGRVLGVVTGVVVLLSLAYSAGGLQVFLWGGNVVFLCFVVGWLLGDIFRPESV